MAKNKRELYLFIFLLLLIVPSYICNAQQNNYIVYFSDKNNSPFTINNPASFLSTKALDRRIKQQISLSSQDLPVNPAYIESLKAKGAEVLVVSKWLNVALVKADANQITEILSLPFVKKTEVALRKTNTKSHLEFQSTTSSLLNPDYGSSYNQLSMIGINEMHNQGFHGEGMLIAVIDGGFQNLNVLPIFDSINIHNRVISTYDFIDHENDVYDDHDHGMKVMSMMASYSEGNMIGGSWRAKYVLLRSEDVFNESLGEEIYWARAAEFADSIGVDIINSSIGYNTFDNSSTNHTYSELDGNTTLITKAAEIAASKGILVINSAGNEGSTSWKYMLAPADGDSVLAVGSVSPDRTYYNGSSVGPSYDGRVKPDVAAQGNGVTIASPGGGTQTGNGTSFATPLITSLAAGIWQAFPHLSNMEVHYYIRRSASQYQNPDFKIGYGIPNFSAARTMIAATRPINASDKESISVMPTIIESQPMVLNVPDKLVGKELTVRFTNINGQFIAEESIPEGERWLELKTNANSWSPGMYLLSVISSETITVLKIVKK